MHSDASAQPAGDEGHDWGLRLYDERDAMRDSNLCSDVKGMAHPPHRHCYCRTINADGEAVYTEESEVLQDHVPVLPLCFQDVAQLAIHALLQVEHGHNVGVGLGHQEVVDIEHLAQ